MTGLRGFGMHVDFAGGGSRQWYAGADGVKRWVDNDARLGTDSSSELAQIIADNSPDDLLDDTLPDELPPIAVPLSLAQLSEGDLTEERR